MTRRSTFTPVCLVYCSASPCQNGFVWSLLYSAITTVMAWPPPDPPQAPTSAMATAPTVRTSMRRLFTRRLSFRRAAAAPIHLSGVGRQEAFIFTLGRDGGTRLAPFRGRRRDVQGGEGANDMSTIL